MARTKKSNYSGTPYQKKNDRISILENGIKNALVFLSKNEIQEASHELLMAWMRESNL